MLLQVALERERVLDTVQSLGIEDMLLQVERQRALGTVPGFGIEDMMLQQDWQELTLL